MSPGGPAEQAGLKTGDVLVAVDGQALRRTGERSANAQLVEYMRGVEPGRVVKVDYLRDGKRRTASVTTAPAEPPIVRVIRERLSGPMVRWAWSGWASRACMGPRAAGSVRSSWCRSRPKLGSYFGTDRGLLVVRAPTGKGLPLEEGDVLQTIDGRTPDGPGHAFRILNSYQPGEKVKLGVLRQRKQLMLEATLPAAETSTRRSAADAHGPAGPGAGRTAAAAPPAPPASAGPA